jgi:acyl-homoserine lactone acylase PvdQ
MSTHMNRMLAFNETDQTITVEAGMMGPAYEALLNRAQETLKTQKAYTGGHFPQSFEFSSVGGWIAALGSGQASSLYGDAADLVRRLSDWDGTAAADSVAALNFFYWHSDMADVLQRPGFEAFQDLPWDREDFSPGFAAAILEQAKRAAASMVEALGSTDVAMGSVFRIGRGERSWPLGGETIADAEMTACVADLSPLCDRTMRAFSSGPPDEQGQRRAYRGSNSMRLVEFSKPVKSWSLHVYGQNDYPASPHFDDQAKLLSEKKFKPTFFNRDELEGHIKSTTELEWIGRITP